MCRDVKLYTCAPAQKLYDARSLFTFIVLPKLHIYNKHKMYSTDIMRRLLVANSNYQNFNSNSQGSHFSDLLRSKKIYKINCLNNPELLGSLIICWFNSKERTTLQQLQVYLARSRSCTNIINTNLFTI